nr:unnamed protein product [Callosobruchus analis]
MFHFTPMVNILCGPKLGSVLKFLTFHFNKGATYGTLNSYRSAISQIAYQTWDRFFGSGAFFKGVIVKRPPKAK